MTRLRYNGLSTTLGASLTSSATAVTFGAALTHSGSTNVPTITGTDYIPLTILDTTGKASEIVYLTAYTAGATSGTITRAQEGTTGVVHASGDKVVHGPTVQDVSGGWVADISDPLTSLAGYTSAAGTWSSDGTSVQQTALGTTAKKLVRNGNKPTGLIIAEVEIREDVSPGAANAWAGLAIGTGSGIGGGGLAVYLQNANDSASTWTNAYVEQDGILALVTAPIITPPTKTAWNKLRVVVIGDAISVYVNGVFQYTTRNVGKSSYYFTQIALQAYNVAASFRNFKTWSLPLPE